jgi:serine/threonine protein kinase/Tfp pilus assembly protein PilF
LFYNPREIMPLNIGAQLGSHEITALLGKGGMGEVYRARDLKLKREVALKILPEEFSRDADRVSRFQREAEVLASLNHPNIAGIYDLAEANGSRYLVLELVEGETLVDWLKGVPSNARKLETARQVLDALRAAHDADIIHRDLKPANIMVRFDGYVKVLDFGLAKRISFSSDTAQDDPTSLTIAGEIVGTVAYMSPEQIQGLRLDLRSDLFAFGIILHEMLMGEHPWRRPTTVDTLHAILHDDVPPNRNTSLMGLSAVIQKLLRKNPDERFQSAADVLETLATRGSSLKLSSKSIHGRKESTVRPLTRLIVLPFRLLRRHEATDFRAVSLPDAITSSLAGLDSLVVRSTMVASRFAGIADLDIHVIAEQAQVDAVLTGTILSDGEHLRVNTQLVDAPNGAVLWSNTSQVSLQNVFQLLDELVDRLIQSLSVPLTSQEHLQLKHDVPASAIAYELYLRANELAVAGYNPSRMILARDLYLRALDSDPQYAPSWVGLGRIYRLIGKYGVGDELDNVTRADDAFRKAFALNPELAEAHNLYTFLQTDLGQSLQAMERLLKRGQTHHHDPNLFAGLVHACRYCGLLEASAAAHDRANQLDPQVRTTVVYTYFQQGDFQKTIDTCGPGDGGVKASALIALGYKEEAIAIAAETARTAPMEWLKSFALSHRALLEGDRKTSLEAFNSFLALPNPLMLDPEGRFWIARDLSGLYDVARALNFLTSSLEGNYGCHYALTHDEGFYALRSHPGFSQLLDRAAILNAEARKVFFDNGGGQLLGWT